MAKTCSYETCSYPVFSGNYCKHHQYLRKDKNIKTINKLSERKRAENEIYEESRQVFLKENPLCKAGLNDCSKIATEIHHMKGRIGENFLDTSTWLSVCRNCHHQIEHHPKEAKELGFSQSRLK